MGRFTLLLNFYFLNHSNHFFPFLDALIGTVGCLYDLEHDPSEVKNLAASMPKKLKVGTEIPLIQRQAEREREGREIEITICKKKNRQREEEEDY